MTSSISCFKTVDFPPQCFRFLEPHMLLEPTTSGAAAFLLGPLRHVLGLQGRNHWPALASLFLEEKRFGRPGLLAGVGVDPLIGLNSGRPVNRRHGLIDARPGCLAGRRFNSRATGRRRLIRVMGEGRERETGPRRIDASFASFGYSRRRLTAACVERRHFVSTKYTHGEFAIPSKHHGSYLRRSSGGLCGVLCKVTLRLKNAPFQVSMSTHRVWQSAIKSREGCILGEDEGGNSTGWDLAE